MNKMIKTAIALIVLTSAFSFADESEGGFKLGFYGTLAGGNAALASYVEATVGTTGAVGVLFNLGSGLEFGLGLGLGSLSVTTTETDGNSSRESERSMFVWEIIPSASYEIGKKDFIRYGAGLNIHLASYSLDETVSGTTTTTKPKNMDMAFFPNFYIKGEVVKNFFIGLKTGLMINMPGDGEEETYGGKRTTETSIIDTKTEVFVNFYL